VLLVETSADLRICFFTSSATSEGKTSDHTIFMIVPSL